MNDSHRVDVNDPEAAEAVEEDEEGEFQFARLAEQIAEAAWDRKALDLKILDVRKLVSYADYFVICSGRSDRQVQAIAQNITAELREQGFRPLGVEGQAHGMWVLMDFGDIIVHIFHLNEREEYGLEQIWKDAPRLDVEVPEGLTTERDAEGQYTSA
jgi:ribosome-associated protein